MKKEVPTFGLGGEVFQSPTTKGEMTGFCEQRIPPGPLLDFAWQCTADQKEPRYFGELLLYSSVDLWSPACSWKVTMRSSLSESRSTLCDHLMCFSQNRCIDVSPCLPKSLTLAKHVLLGCYESQGILILWIHPDLVIVSVRLFTCFWHIYCCVLWSCWFWRPVSVAIPESSLWMLVTHWHRPTRSCKCYIS